MNVNARNQDKSDDENLFGIKKTTYWQIYGVKSFPYRGKRKFTPLLYPSLDGGMVISNDVFGLTISQFERMYKACLERRKTKEQWILNLRYPDKSSKEYLEFLENCTECNDDHLPWRDQREKYLYDNLIKTVGNSKTKTLLVRVTDKNIMNEDSEKTHTYIGLRSESLVPKKSKCTRFIYWCQEHTLSLL
ncbi:unnamed protein product [Mytilus edulis]|uniref:Uncharacterized protein n=1 Tax=Mytilus edulis TaxID=6550 RepID=A0A8S3UWD4_MYTED|nr:unnamed protein product [Mytilus edulis]